MKIIHGLTRKQNTSLRAGSNTHPLARKPKGSNGVVAVGFPHRNYSVFKQADPNKRQVKRKKKKKEQGEHQRIYIRRSIKNGGLKGSKKG